MQIILLSGGSGQRLWPLSNDTRSKQFLKLLRNEQTNEFESMFQRTCRKFKEAGLEGNIVVAANLGQKDLIENQSVLKVHNVYETERRDTFPAIALANAYLMDELSVNEDEVVVVCPIDTFAESEFYKKIIELAQTFEKTSSNLGLLGVEPTYPSSKYGYIVPQKSNDSSTKVQRFVEKPTEEAASKLIAEGALWNCGIFAFKAGYLKQIMIRNFEEPTYNWLGENYKQLPKISFDYEVVEKESNIMVVKYIGEWKDLGTWNTLTDEIKEPVIGKGQLSTDSKNTHIINELGISVNVMGAKNLVVVASPDGILVSEKTQSHRLKEFNNLKEFRPMYEERRWGYYQVLDFKAFDDGMKSLTKRLTILKDKNISYQQHYKRSEVWTIISGKAEFILNDKISTVGPGDVLKIAIGDKHGIRALEDTEIIEVQLGTELIEEDILRLALVWEAIPCKKEEVL